MPLPNLFTHVKLVTFFGPWIAFEAFWFTNEWHQDNKCNRTSKFWSPKAIILPVQIFVAMPMKL
jgi:hypothetical protein